MCFHPGPPRLSLCTRTVHVKTPAPARPAPSPAGPGRAAGSRRASALSDTREPRRAAPGQEQHRRLVLPGEAEQPHLHRDQHPGRLAEVEHEQAEGTRTRQVLSRARKLVDRRQPDDDQGLEVDAAPRRVGRKEGALVGRQPRPRFFTGNRADVHRPPRPTPRLSVQPQTARTQRDTVWVNLAGTPIPAAHDLRGRKRQGQLHRPANSGAPTPRQPSGRRPPTIMSGAPLVPMS